MAHKRYAGNHSFSRTMLPEMKRLMLRHLVRIMDATEEQDQREATDLIVLQSNGLRIACRARRAAPGYAERYAWQFTLRVQSGAALRNEYQKVLEDGWGDLMFYGHQSPLRADRFARWVLIDLAALRSLYLQDQLRVVRGDLPRMPTPQRNAISNGDGTAFVAFDFRKFPSVVRDCHPPLEQAAPKPINGKVPGPPPKITEAKLARMHQQNVFRFGDDE